MPVKEYIIFCDESDQGGRYYSNFYGGLLVGSSHYQTVTERLNRKKQQLNLFGEVKWSKVTQRYLDKYQQLIASFFDEIVSGNVRVRIMFRQNAHVPLGLTDTHQEIGFFLLYYQFIKHAFGLGHISPSGEGTRLRLYSDQFPDTKEKIESFKGYLLGLQESSAFRNAGISIQRQESTEVRSHNHVLLQCLDIVLGSMSFRLNDKHKEKPPGQWRRGKRTRAKESLYKDIYRHICRIHPRFNIGVTTRVKDYPRDRFLDPYLHWSFVPKSSKFDSSLTKGD